MEVFITWLRRLEKPGFIAILILALGLRLCLALVNREANDPHMEVVTWILTHHELPIKTSGDCWECFQPKLFHASLAALIQVLKIESADSQIVLAQMVNALTGSLMVGYAFFLIRQLPIGSPLVKLTAFGLLALNPGLVSINIQATNDTFAITFSFIAVYYAYHLLAQPTETNQPQRNWLNLSAASLFAALAILAKTNAAVTAIAILAAFLVKAVFQQRHQFYVYAVLFFTACALLVIPNPLSQYIVNYRQFGTPVTLTINVEKQPLPRFFEQTETHRPGILSIQDGFLTFKLIELLKEPQNSSSNKIYPPHRTSFWTLLYARTHFIQFNQWPPSWLTTSSAIRNLGRLLYLFALLPSLALVLGFCAELFRGLLSIRIQPRAPWVAFLSDQVAFQEAGLLLALLIGYLGFQTVYALQYRIYTVIKAIFIFPAWPSLLFFYIAGLAWLRHPTLHKLAWLEDPIMISSGGLLILYTLDSLALFFQLIR